MTDQGSSTHTKARHAFYYSSGWGDMIGSLRESDKKASLIWEDYRDTSSTEAFMSSAAPGSPTELSFKYQFDHDWDPSAEDIRFHWHWEPQANPASDEVVKLTGYYLWSRVGVATPALTGWTAFSRLFTVSNGDVYIPRVDLIVAIPIPSYAKESSILKIYLTRPFGDVEDTYDTTKSYGTGHANVLVDYFDCHYWRSKTGTKEEYPSA